MAKRLIINADDCNLTAGVTRAILLAHDRGVVTSTTLLMNLPLTDETVNQLKKRRNLGLGVHLNVTLGKPLSLPSQIKSLLKSGGIFKRPEDYKKNPSVEKDLIQEYEAQLRLFEKRFKTRPDHMDMHHHLHDAPVFFKAYTSVAKKWKLPLRRSSLFQNLSVQEAASFKTTDYLFGNLEAKYLWEPVPFWGVVENHPQGSGEIACHPGYYDAQLRQISSLRQMREVELRVLSDPKAKKKIAEFGIELINFSQL